MIFRSKVDRSAKRRKRLRIALIVVVVLVLIRVVGVAAVPGLIDGAVRERGFAATIGELEVSLLTGEIQLWHLDLRATDAAEDEVSFLDLEYVTLDVDVSALLTGSLVVHRAEIDGLDVHLAREAMGDWNFAPLIASTAVEEVAEEEDESPAGIPEIDLSSPIRIAALRAQHVIVHIADHAVDPPFETRLRVNLRASDLGSPGRVARLEADVACDGALDAMRCDAAIDLTNDALDFEGVVVVDGAHPKRLAPYLEPLGIDATANYLSFRAEASAHAKVLGETRDAVSVDLDLTQIALLADGGEAVAVDSIAVDIDRLSTAGAEVSNVVVSGVRAEVALREDGAVAALGLDVRPVDAPDEAGPASDAEADQPRATTDSSAEPFPWSVGLVSGREFRLRFRDESFDPPVQLELTLDELDWTSLGSPEQSELSLSVSLPGIFERLAVEGVADVVQPDKVVDLAVSVDGIVLDGVQPYLEAAGLEAALESGSFRCRLVADAGMVGERLEARATLSSVELVDGDEIAGVDALTANGIALDPLNGLAVGTITLENARVVVPLDDRPLALRTDARIDDLSKFDVRFRAEELIEELKIAGTLSTPDDVIHLALNVGCIGIRTERVSSLLTSAGVAWPMESGTIACSLSADLRPTEDGWSAWGALRDVELTEQGTKLIALEELEIAQAELGEDGIRIESIEISGPFAGAIRDAEGALTVCGVSFLPPPEEADTAQELATDEPGPSDEEPSAAEAPPRVQLGTLTLRDARVHWVDAFVEPNVDVVVTSNARLSNFILGDATQPAELTTELALDGVIDSARLTGKLEADPDDLRWSATLDMTGVRSGALASYLPPGISIELEDGRVRADVAVESALVPEGGRSAHLVLSDVRFQDGEDGQPLFALSECGVVAPRIDVDGGVIEIESLALTGVEVDVTQLEGGVLRTLGITLTPVEAETPPEPAEPEENVEEIPSAPSWARRFDGVKLPHVTLNHFEVELARLGFHDESVPDAVPLAASLRVSHAEPLVLLSEEPGDLAPMELAIEGAITPLVEKIDASLVLAPWQEESSIIGTLAMTGIRGQGVTEVFPALADTIDGTALQDGTFAGAMEVRLIARRRNPLDFDLRHGFGLTLQMHDVALRDGPDGEVFAGLGSLDAQVARILPDNGDVHVESIEFRDIEGFVRRRAEGIELAGLLLKTPEQTEEIEPAPEVDETEEVDVEPEPDVVGPPAGEIRIDELLVNGLDFEIRDESVEPPMIMPLDMLDVELQRFSTRTFADGQPFRFEILLGGGDVSLPKRKKATSAIAGLAGAAVSAIAGSGDEHELEERPVFTEIALSGQLGLGEYPVGWTQMNIDALELLHFAPSASGAGVNIGGGVMDAFSRTRFKGERGLSVDSRIDFTDLSLDEAPGGPISTYLKLPAPLDSVLFLLRDKNGAHRIPVNFNMDADGISPAQIGSVAVRTLSEVIARAVANAPLRAAGTVTGMFGLTGTEEKPGIFTRLTQPVLRVVGLGAEEGPVAEPVDVRFDAGQTALLSADRARLEPMLEELGEKEKVVLIVQHAFGGADFARAAELANPDPEDCLELAIHLRKRKAQLGRLRAELAAEALSTFIVNGEDQAQSDIDRLRSVDRQLGETEDALDKVLGLLRPGAERHADRRARAASLEIAEARVTALKAHALHVLDEDFDEARIEIQKPRLEDVREDGSGGVVLTLRARRSE